MSRRTSPQTHATRSMAATGRRRWAAGAAHARRSKVLTAAGGAHATPRAYAGPGRPCASWERAFYTAHRCPSQSVREGHEGDRAEARGGGPGEQARGADAADGKFVAAELHAMGQWTRGHPTALERGRSEARKWHRGFGQSRARLLEVSHRRPVGGAPLTRLSADQQVEHRFVVGVCVDQSARAHIPRRRRGVWPPVRTASSMSSSAVRKSFSSARAAGCCDGRTVVFS